MATIYTKPTVRSRSSFAIGLLYADSDRLSSVAYTYLSVHTNQCNSVCTVAFQQAAPPPRYSAAEIVPYKAGKVPAYPLYTGVIIPGRGSEWACRSVHSRVSAFDPKRTLGADAMAPLILQECGSLTVGRHDCDHGDGHPQLVCLPIGHEGTNLFLDQ